MKDNKRKYKQTQQETLLEEDNKIQVTFEKRV
jgi:hypothetical protein